LEVRIVDFLSEDFLLRRFDDYIPTKPVAHTAFINYNKGLHCVALRLPILKILFAYCEDIDLSDLGRQLISPIQSDKQKQQISPLQNEQRSTICNKHVSRNESSPGDLQVAEKKQDVEGAVSRRGCIVGWNAWNFPDPHASKPKMTK
jgi:hypothetical protein